MITQVRAALEPNRLTMHILYATDGSEGATAAARLLAALPLDTDTTVTILTVAADARDADDNAVREMAEDVVSAAAGALGHSTAGLGRQVRRGRPAAEILRAAEERPTDLIVLGSHGHSAVARFLLGSVAERVARHAPCAVLLVRGAGTAPRRVLLGVDGSAGARRAADWLKAFPLPIGCEVRLVTILPNLHDIARERLLLTPPLVDNSIALDVWQREQAETRLNNTAASFAAARKTAVTEIRSGDAALALLGVAADEAADVIVVGSHGQSAVERFLLGSVSQQLLTHAECSVLVVRGPGDS